MIRHRIAVATLTALTATLATTAAGFVVGAGSAAADTECPGLYVVAVPGTWETSESGPAGEDSGLLNTVTAGLPTTVRVDYVNYAATAFPWEGEVYGQSKAEAIGNARAMVADMANSCASTRIALLGYSQGADAAGDLAAEIGSRTSVVAPERMAAVGLISDPRRSPGDMLVGAPVAGAGASGPRPGGFGALASKVRTFCAEGDLYCATPPEDFVTRFAGFVAQLSDPNPLNTLNIQLEAEAIVGDLLAAGGLPALQNQFTAAANETRISQLEQFYRSQVHASYASYPVADGQTATSWLHNWLSGLT
ncbi:cutinase family protein [Nocardia sp. NPDC051030]|uniref:cutinase family protein n=1 Tax=Nocardia sp. NPDC051030 TaxID=3155162 RepID=UPI0034191F3A